MHPAARVLRSPRLGLRGAGPLQLPADAARRGHAHLQAGRRAAGQPARLGDPLRRDGIKRTPLVRLAWLATASARHHLLIRRHLTTGDLAFCYCYLPEGQPASPSRPIRAAGLRWPAEEDSGFGKDCFGPGQSQVRLYAATARHTVLVMAALAICAVTAALLRRHTDTQPPAPAYPDQPPPTWA